jgi:hypothetical protein
MTEDTNRSWKRPIVPHNPNGETDPDKIDWESDSVENLNINWDRIEFLRVYKRDGGFVIQRHPKVPQIGGLGAILAYQANLCRLMRSSIGGGEEFIKEAEKHGVLFNIALTLARGGELPLN